MSTIKVHVHRADYVNLGHMITLICDTFNYHCKWRHNNIMVIYT